MTSQQTAAFVDAAQSFFTEDNRQKLCASLGLPPVGTWADIIKTILAIFTQISPLISLFTNCPPTPAPTPTPNVPPKPPIN